MESFCNRALEVFTNTNLSLALNSSLESWTVGSGGNDSRGQSSGDNDIPNIFNNSKRRVETQNLIGSISLPLTWHSNERQFTLIGDQLSATAKEKDKAVPENFMAPIPPLAEGSYGIR